MAPLDDRTLADRLIEFCVDQLQAFERRHARGFVLPRTFAGHAVGPDVTADLLFVLGHLADAGVTAVAGRAPDVIAAQLLRTVRGAATHSFYSYRVAETLLRRGAFAGNPLLQGCDEAQRAQVTLACDSRDWFRQLGPTLPRNFAAVQARCELARQRLGLLEERATLDQAVERLRLLLSDNPWHYLDDSGDRSGRYDIYTADIWLFCEPLSVQLGPLWELGARSALELVDLVGTPGGAAIPWGRSTGVLALALTVELCALTLARGLCPERAGAWLRRGFDAFTSVTGLYADGVVRAHQNRAQDGYRGPARRLQLSFDVLGKLAWSAATLRGLRERTAAASHAQTYRDHDRLHRFGPSTNAAVWSYRKGAFGFVLPFVGPVRSHYLPAPQAPGCFEVPVDADLPCWTPLVLAPQGRFTAGGVPASLVHEPGSVAASWDQLLPTRPGSTPLAGRRRARFRVEGRALVLEESIDLEQAAHAISLAFPALSWHPLRVEVLSSSGHGLTHIDVSGIAEWRSFWSEIQRVSQLELEPGRELRAVIRVTPLVRVASTAPHRHHYHRSLYQPLGKRVAVSRAWNRRPCELDVFHLHWPEWLGLPDLAAHQAVIEGLREARVPIVWTAHNLIPHDKRREVHAPIYEAWAAAAAAVIHHSAHGQQRMCGRYRFAPGCRHLVIPHGHFGGAYPAIAPSAAAARALAERELQLEPAEVRIGVLGAPRQEKRNLEFLQGAAASANAGVQVVCWSLPADQTAPPSPRIAIAERYQDCDDRTYALRLAACDALALPVDPDGEMLASGVVADAVGAGLAVLGSDWGYLAETLGEALIPCGHTAESTRAALDALDPARVAQARAASAALRASYDWAKAAARTADLFDSLLLQPYPGDDPDA